MRFIAQKSLALFVASLCLAGTGARAALAAEFTQEGAQKIAEKMNNTASDDSLEASTTSAMNAIMNLAALNIPGAFSNGYKAYGQYINSEKLDDMEAKAKTNKGALLSIGSNIAGEQAAAARATSFSRLDPSFLRRGEAGTLADEFEKRSGMRREEFLRQLGSATDSDLTYDDPALAQKLENRFQQFTSAIPNKDFKRGIETAAAMIPASARGEALGKLQNLYADSWKGADPTPVAENDKAEVMPAAEALAPAAEDTQARAPASVAPETGPSLSAQAGLLLGINQNSDVLKDLLNSNEGNENDSIFRKVSNRYRLLTPALVGKR